MATKEQWIDLFEKVVGRKPTPEEIIKAKNADFDKKKIKKIANIDDSQPQTTVKEVIIQFGGEDEDSSSSKDEGVLQGINYGGTKSSSQTLSQQPVLTKHFPKKSTVIGGLLVFLVLILAAGYYYMNKTTGMDVAIEEFSTAAKSNDYDRIASLLSTKDAKWSKTEAKDFITYLNDEGVNIETELKAIEASGGKNTYNDQNGNKLLGLQETSRKLGIFPEYQVVSYPLEITVNSNLTDLVINETKIEANKETSLGEFRFANQTLKAKGTTKLGAFETELQPSLQQASENKLALNLSTVKKQLNLALPSEVASATDIKVSANGKEIATDLQSSVEVLENQKLEVVVDFKYEGGAYKTEATTVLVDPASDELATDLTISSDTSKKIAEAKKAKEDKETQARADEAQAKAYEEQKQKIYSFITSHREAVHYSIKYKTNTFAKYYDTSSQIYQEVVAVTTGGAPIEQGIKEYEAISLEILTIAEHGGRLFVLTYEEALGKFMNGNPDKLLQKNKRYHLVPHGDSYLITQIDLLSSN
ncbi:TPA: hypothetical protein ACGO35_001813 [Streptococcus suis]